MVMCISNEVKGMKNKMKNFGNIIWGILLIVIGLVVGINALGIANISIFFDGWWTLFIIIPCLVGLFNERKKTGNIIGLLIGIILLLCCQGILDFDMIWSLLLPTILVIIGASLIFRDSFNHKVNEEIKKINKSKIKDDGYCATFSEQKIKIENEEFLGTDLTSVFGSIKCDLKDAIIKKDVVINVTSIFGGTEIHVPDNVKVKVKSSSIFGGVDEKKKDNKELESEHTIYINATCLFGGVEIK